jgi:polyisoprenoid-binding protein YceI
VGEVFINQNNLLNVARGVTPQVSGDILVDRQSPQNSTLGTITVDISQFTSDSPRRDGALRERFLESARYPLATFVPTQISGLPATYQEGEQISFQVSGDLTIRETTWPATFDVTMQIGGDTLSGEAKSTILMSDFGIGPISIAGILKTEDEINLTFTFQARP